ncbi:MAG: cytochrome-c peroxidase [Fluviicola sp.]|jgi:cytochrome c peroxidase|uniref:cytochrome-c peroxidase n=1 Tax=Fluviicola sp. TaxID=1917219 RepID=UPI00261747FC|nr:cytochrome c peroxidase [Fluviicola sp.]MDF3028803.1 cytochrome-c peroxidase [Fluviicola sp.]
MKRLEVLCLTLILLMVSFRYSEELWKTPSDWPEPVYNFKKNPLDSATVQLGRVLFYDPVLSADSTVSCASCHSPYNAFTHVDHALSHGIKDRIGTRNSPVLVNLAWGKSFMWDGAVNHLDMQALAPLENHLEMDETLPHVLQKIKLQAKYKRLFKAAFRTETITGERFLKAISQFMLTLVSADSKYDQVIRGEKGISFTEQESNGYLLFKEHCASCHTEPLFTNQTFQNNGLAPDSLLKDAGRMNITRKSSDSLKFKVPTLRNIERSAPYMHDGRYRSLQMVLFHYSSDVHSSVTLAPELRGGINLTEADKRNLIAFLKTLTDNTFLNNKQFQYPRTF